MKLRGDGSLAIPEGGENAVRHLEPNLSHPHKRKWAESRRILTTLETPKQDENNQERHFEILTIKARD